MSSSKGLLRSSQLPRLQELLALYGLRADKSLSQNFLLGPSIPERIAAVALPPPSPSAAAAGGGQGDGLLPAGPGVARRNGTHPAPTPPTRRRVLEVGPGLGSLTRALLDRGGPDCCVLGVEKDERFRPPLSQLEEASEGRFHVEWADILHPSRPSASWPDAWPPGLYAHTHIVGNLPYQISSVLLAHWMHELAEGTGLFARATQPPVDWTLLVQREVGARLVAPQGREVSRLSFLVHSLCRVEECFLVPRTAFTPVPRVDGMVVRLVPLREPVLRVSSHQLVAFLVPLFQGRRKQLRVPLLAMLRQAGQEKPEPGSRAEEILAQLLQHTAIDGGRRVEELSVAEVNALAHAFYHHPPHPPPSR